MEGKSFFELFKGAVIENTKLTKSQKLQQLKCSLTGDADKILHSITITNDNFDFAIDILESRFDNKSLILQSELHEIFKPRSLITENSKDLRILRETTKEHHSFCLTITTSGSTGYFCCLPSDGTTSY